MTIPELKLLIDILQEKEKTLTDTFNKEIAPLKNMIELHKQELDMAYAKERETEQRERLTFERELNSISSVHTPPPALEFPARGPIPTQIIFALKAANKPLRTVEIEDEIEKQTGNSYELIGILRTMQSAGILRLLKLNNSNKKAYWVLAEWIERNSLKSDYMTQEMMTYTKDQLVIT